VTPAEPDAPAVGPSENRASRLHIDPEGVADVRDGTRLRRAGSGRDA
jgi:hypothetical protein